MEYGNNVDLSFGSNLSPCRGSELFVYSCGQFYRNWQNVVVMVDKKGDNLHNKQVLSIWFIMAAQYTRGERLQHLKFIIRATINIFFISIWIYINAQDSNWITIVLQENKYPVFFLG